MNRSQALSPHPDFSRKFVHDAKNLNDSEVLTSSDSETSFDPRASHCYTPDFESESDEETKPYAPLDGAAQNRILSSADHIQVQGEPILTGPRVRFRSRVRISAGMGRRQRRLSDGFSSTASSISGSPSSSISAPLRTQHTGNNGWVPLGSRMNLLASQAAPHPLSRDDCASAGGSGNGDGHARMQCARSLQILLDDDVDEQTHLMTSATRHSYVGNGHAH
ncbi:hypothetical protein J3R82DRAFT_1250 [Butyriboletus roseoflavus]|nr:hypothetical protein J3R82DRAFT_1250 [Butyriboletus roseoflavus]